MIALFPKAVIGRICHINLAHLLFKLAVRDDLLPDVADHLDPQTATDGNVDMVCAPLLLFERGDVMKMPCSIETAAEEVKVPLHSFSIGDIFAVGSATLAASDLEACDAFGQEA